MNMPVYLRKFWIDKHNRSMEESRAEKEGMTTIGGSALNAYAKLEQGNARNGV